MPFNVELLNEFLRVAGDQTTGRGVTATATEFERRMNGEFHLNLEMQASFGIGRASRVPWVVFLGEGQRVKKGIYPALLFYKAERLLVVSYGISESEAPNRRWNLAVFPPTIAEVFLDRGLEPPKKYGSSYVKNVYDLSAGADVAEQVIDAIGDVAEVFNSDGGTIAGMDAGNRHEEQSPGERRFEVDSFVEAARGANYYITSELANRFVSSMLSRRFTILAGLAGSGKTKLAIAFAKWICEASYQYKVVAVGADWTNREPLLGYLNALNPDQYMVPENGFLATVIAARKSWEMGERRPFFVILDEMNLSHVERYFADFLSSMESGEPIRLHTSETELSGIPNEIVVPPNLFVVGTVNIDETTYMFSPKVLDRANVIEFRISADELGVMMNAYRPLQLDLISGAGVGVAGEFVGLAADDPEIVEGVSRVTDVLLEFFSELKPIGAEFGFRAASDVLRYCRVGAAIADVEEQDWLIDTAILQKLLPKMHGSRRKLEPSIKAMSRLCLAGSRDEVEIERVLTPRELWPAEVEVRFPLTLEKLGRMHRSLIDNGFTSFAEA